MDKSYFLNSVNCEDKNLISSIFNKMQIAQKSNKVVYTNDFVSPAIWNQILNICENYEVKSFSNGIFEEADRRILSFSSYEEPVTYPIDLLKISCSSKFAKLLHKDYLGAIMSLGIKRERLGDLIIQDTICYVPVCHDISNYIINNLGAIGHHTCEVMEYDYTEKELPKRQFEERTIIATSLRLDAVVSSICNISRNNSVELIVGAKILINYFQCLKKDKVMKDGDTLTIRGYGKFKISHVMGVTQKDRLKVLIYQYM